MDRSGLFACAQIIFFIFGKYRDQEYWHVYAPKDVEGSIASTFAAAFARDTDLTQPAA